MNLWWTNGRNEGRREKEGQRGGSKRKRKDGRRQRHWRREGGTEKKGRWGEYKFYSRSDSFRSPSSFSSTPLACRISRVCARSSASLWDGNCSPGCDLLGNVETHPHSRTAPGCRPARQREQAGRSSLHSWTCPQSLGFPYHPFGGRLRFPRHLASRETLRPCRPNSVGKNSLFSLFSQIKIGNSLKKFLLMKLKGNIKIVSRRPKLSDLTEYILLSHTYLNESGSRVYKANSKFHSFTCLFGLVVNNEILWACLQNRLGLTNLPNLVTALIPIRNCSLFLLLRPNLSCSEWVSFSSLQPGPASRQLYKTSCSEGPFV